MKSIEFLRIVHALDRTELQVFDLKPATEEGALLKTMTDKLMQICEKDPTYHIATIISYGIYVNRYLPKGLFYYLCAGNKNPYIISYAKHNWEHYEWLKIHWFEHDID